MDKILRHDKTKQDTTKQARDDNKTRHDKQARHGRQDEKTTHTHNFFFFFVFLSCLTLFVYNMVQNIEYLSTLPCFIYVSSSLFCIASTRIDKTTHKTRQSNGQTDRTRETTHTRKTQDKTRQGNTQDETRQDKVRRQDETRKD